jgi:predicted lysophospholipase L1 biosynthesis ABC-type transport system permease subunit
MSPDARFARIGLWIVVATAVATSLTLIAVSSGAENKVSSLIADPRLAGSPLIDISLIRAILHQLTVIVVALELSTVAILAWVLGEIAMRSRRREIAIRRLDGALRSRLMREFMLQASITALAAGLCGELFGIAATVLVGEVTVLPARPSALSVLLPLPVAVLLTIAANGRPAWHAANTPISEAMTR